MKGEVQKLANLFDLIVAVFLCIFVLAQPISIAATEIAYSAAVLAWVTRLVLARRGVLHDSPLDWPILIYLLLCTASTLVSPLPASSWEGMRKVSLIFLVLLVAHNAVNATRAKQFVALLLVAGLASVAWATWLYAAGVGLRIHDPQPDSAFLRAGIHDNDIVLRVDGRRIYRPAQFVALLNSKPAAEPLRLRVSPGGGIEIPVLKNAASYVIPPGEWPRPNDTAGVGMRIETARPARAFGFYTHYITYAFVVELLGCLAFGLWLGHSKPFSASGLTLALSFMAFALAMGMTLTRSAWMSLAFGCAVAAWFRVRRTSVRLLLLAVPLLALAGTRVAMRRFRGVGLVDMADQGTDYRLLMWKDGLRIIREHPWFGVGMNTVRDWWWKFDLAAYKKYGLQSHFHSTPIQIAVETGLPALIAWLTLMTCYLVLLIRLAARAREQGDTFSYGLALGILGGTAGFLAGSLVQYDYGDSLPLLLFWFLMGLALAVREQLEKRTVV